MYRILHIVIIMLMCFSSYLQAQSPPILWATAYGKNSDWSYGESVEQTSDGGFIIAGYRERFRLLNEEQSDSYQIYVVRTDSNGDTVWTREYGGTNAEEAYSVQQTDDGGFVIVGGTRSFGSGNADVYIIRINSIGDTLWTKVYGTFNTEIGYSISNTHDSGFIITGYHHSELGIKPVVYLIRTDYKGDTLWTRTYGDTLVNIGYSVQNTSDSGFIITGYSGSFAYLIRTDSKGDTLWTKKYGYRATGWSVQQTSDSGFIVSGQADNSKNFQCLYLIRTDKNGDTLWTKMYEEAQRGYSVDITSDGGFVVGGLGDGDLYILKTDSNGEKQWSTRYGGNMPETGKCAKQTKDGGYVLTGRGRLETDSGGVFFLLIRFDKENTAIQSNGDSKYSTKRNLSLIYEYKDNSVLIKYTIPVSGNIKLEVFDTLGKRVRVIADRYMRKGEHSMRWNIKRDKHNTDGVYLIRLSANDYSISKKVTIVK